MTFKALMSKPIAFIGQVVKKSGKILSEKTDMITTKTAYVYKSRKITVEDKSGSITKITCGNLILR